jgi:hypothetical protein
MQTQTHGDSFAVFDDSMAYRYRLVRQFKFPDDYRVIFIMLNPSTADAFKNDPTVSRCCRYVKDWGGTSLEVLNIFALRSTDPHALYVSSDPVGEMNTETILKSVTSPIVDKVIAAWGAHGALRSRGTFMRKLLQENCPKVYRLGDLTAGGQPRHPLYLKASLEPVLL